MLLGLILSQVLLRADTFPVQQMDVRQDSIRIPISSLRYLAAYVGAVLLISLRSFYLARILPTRALSKHS